MKRTIRLACDASANPDSGINLLTNRVPQFFSGTSLQFQLGLFDSGALADLTDIETVRVEIKDKKMRVNDLGLLVKEIDAVDIETGLAIGDWNAGTDQHVEFTCTPLETNLYPGEHVLVVSAWTTSETDRVTFLRTPIIVEEDKTGDPGLPPLGAHTEGFLSGTGVPSSGLGIDTYHYQDISTGDLYKKVSGSWALQYSPATGICKVVANAAARAAAVPIAVGQLLKQTDTGEIYIGNASSGWDLVPTLVNHPTPYSATFDNDYAVIYVGHHNKDHELGTLNHPFTDINDAFAAAGSVSSRKVIISLGVGEFMLDQLTQFDHELRIIGTHNATNIYNNKTSSVIRTTHRSAPMLECLAEWGHNLSFENVCFVGFDDDGNPLDHACLKFTNGTGFNTRIIGCHFRGFEYAIEAEHALVNLYVENCTAADLGVIDGITSRPSFNTASPGSNPSFSVGDYVWYNSAGSGKGATRIYTLYKANTPVPAGTSWNASSWDNMSEEGTVVGGFAKFDFRPDSAQLTTVTFIDLQLDNVGEHCLLAYQKGGPGIISFKGVEFEAARNDYEHRRFVEVVPYNTGDHGFASDLSLTQNSNYGLQFVVDSVQATWGNPNRDAMFYQRPRDFSSVLDYDGDTDYSARDLVKALHPAMRGRRQNEGTLISGAWYEIIKSSGSASFTGSGAADNNVGTTFQANSTTPTWDSGNGAVVRRFKRVFMANTTRSAATNQATFNTTEWNGGINWSLEDRLRFTVSGSCLGRATSKSFSSLTTPPTAYAGWHYLVLNGETDEAFENGLSAFEAIQHGFVHWGADPRGSAFCSFYNNERLPRIDIRTNGEIMFNDWCQEHDQSTMPLQADQQGGLYMKWGFLICRYRENTVTRYKYLDMRGSGTTWQYSSTEPTR